MTTEATSRKVSILNLLVRVVREWQRGATNTRHRNAELGRYLTQEQMDSLTPHLYRTISESDLASRIASTIGL